MEVSSAAHPQGSFPFMSLPLELRRKVYCFAVMRTRPIKLRINYHGLATTDTLGPGRVRMYTAQDFRMLETNIEFRKELSDALYVKSTFDLYLWWQETEKGTRLFQIDPRRIMICRLSIHDLANTIYTPHRDVWGGAFPLYWHHHLRAFVATLVFNGHQIESMLVECEEQDSNWLLECLRPMAMLRNFGLVHFRSCRREVHPYFRFLEAYMMSDRDVPFRDWQGFRKQTEPWRPHFLSEEARRGPPPRSTDMTDEGVTKSKEDMEATAQILYAILQIEDEMRPQQDL